MTSKHNLNTDFLTLPKGETRLHKIRVPNDKKPRAPNVAWHPHLRINQTLISSVFEFYLSTLRLNSDHYLFRSYNCLNNPNQFHHEY